jgi:hypothetical protein
LAKFESAARGLPGTLGISERYSCEDMDGRYQKVGSRNSHRWNPLSLLLRFASLVSLAQSLPQNPAINDVAAPPTSIPTLLDVFQVYTPVHMPQDVSCEVKLMDHSFGFSYGKPFVGKSSGVEVTCLTF